MPVPLRRIATTALRALGRPRNLVSRLPHHVHLSYVDLNRHMNYASYLEVMELGRWHWGLVSGALRALLGTKLWPVVVKVDIEYRRELKPLQRFVVDTRLVGFEKRMMCFEQHVIVGDRVHAKAHVYALALRGGKVVDAKAVEEAGAAYVAEPLEVVGQRVVQRAA
ncbi:MAG: acyl-CoA thioesterase [Deltaproteobacteria bacterium]|jgi:acyl-CoA thioesterase FadM|nr:acyl-CoA thioesterase [Deltaproteobacteria bacterium]MBW2537828.1 acyl-CoA thioesterase [Deltaproteobacteria bacterium]